MRKYAFNIIFTLLTVGTALAWYHHFILPETIPPTVRHAIQVNELMDAANYNQKPKFNAPTDPDLFIGVSGNARQAVVSVRATRLRESGYFREKYSRSNGSGVIVSPEGHIVTNYHVIEDANDIKIRLEDKREFKATLLGHDLSTDIALLKLEAAALPYLSFGNSDSLRVGEWVLAVGNPFNLQSSVTAGIVSAKARSINLFDRQGIESFIQTDAAINPGNSGGALINTKGQLMGINTAIMSYSGKYEGFSFAVPSNLVKKVIDDIRTYGAVQRAWLGVSIFDVDEKRAESVGLDFIGGVYIDIVDKDGAAQKAGLKAHDVIVSIEGTPTLSTPSFLETIGRYRPGNKVEITYYRNGKRHITNAVLRNQLNTTDFVAVRKDEILKNLGFELRDLNALERERFDRTGVLVVSIYKDSKIARTNMDPGYIITQLNNKRITTVNELIAALKSEEGEITLRGFYENYPGEWPYKFDIDS